MSDVRYEVRKLDSGWAVWDTATNTPANVKGSWQVSLSMEDADDLTDLLNQIHFAAKDTTAH